MITTHSRSFRLALVAFGMAVAVPAFASAAVPLCGDHDEKSKAESDKSKSENKETAKEKEAKKKPVNQG